MIQKTESDPLSKMPQNKPITEPDKLYERALIKTILRIVGFLILTVLNFSLVASLWVQLQAHQRVNWQLEGVTFLAVAFFDFSILIPIIFEVRKLRLWNDRLILNTLFWQSQLMWADIVELKLPSFFAIAVLKTKRTFYIINKKDYKEFQEMVDKLEGKIATRQNPA